MPLRSRFCALETADNTSPNVERDRLMLCASRSVSPCGAAHRYTFASSKVHKVQLTHFDQRDAPALPGGCTGGCMYLYVDGQNNVRARTMLIQVRSPPRAGPIA